MAKRALVTGAAGFIGAHVAEHCLKLGLAVTGTDDLSGGFMRNVPTGVRFIQGDLRDETFVDSLWANQRYDYVYHLAAYAAEGLSHFVRNFNYSTNLVASINLINNSVRHEVSCFVFTSSIAVYGTNQAPFREDMTPRPEDPYGISKYAVELDLECAHRLFGLDYIIFRPHNVYGERQNIVDRYRNVIGIFMNQVLNEQELTVFGDGCQTRAFTHIDDVAPIIAKSPFVPEAIRRTFNVGAEKPYTVLELASEVATSFGVPCRVTHLPARHEAVHAFSDHSLAHRVFGFSPTVDLSTGIRRMADWVKIVGAGTPVRFSPIEVSKNLPPSWAEISS